MDTARMICEPLVEGVWLLGECNVDCDSAEVACAYSRANGGQRYIEDV